MPLPDTIMDGAFTSYKIAIGRIDPDKDASMREVIGLNPSLARL